MTVENFLRSRAPLSTGHAVAALLVLEDGRYIMQLRDDLPDIWYPGHWGLFGGGIDEGEDGFNRDSPDDSRTGVNIRAFPALQQD